MNDHSHRPVKPSDLPPEVRAELLGRVQNLPNEVLIDSNKTFDELRRRARARAQPSGRIPEKTFMQRSSTSGIRPRSRRRLRACGR
jgi:hypothetical protein